MENNLLALAASIILRSDHDHPADAVLRSHLKAQRGLTPFHSAELSRSVFAYFRWFGWLDLRQPLPDQIEHALQLARKFSDAPFEFSDDDLITLAVPRWLRDVFEINPAWVRAIQSEPRIWLRARPGQGR